MGGRNLIGHGPHRYFHQVVALNAKVGQTGFAAAKATREKLASEIEGKVLAWGAWIGVFERKLWSFVYILFCTATLWSLSSLGIKIS